MARRRSRKKQDAALIVLPLVIGAIIMVVEAIADVIAALGPWVILSLVVIGVAVLFAIRSMKTAHAVASPARPPVAPMPESGVMQLTVSRGSETNGRRPRDGR